MNPGSTVSFGHDGARRTSTSARTSDQEKLKRSSNTTTGPSIVPSSPKSAGATPQDRQSSHVTDEIKERIKRLLRRGRCHQSRSAATVGTSIVRSSTLRSSVSPAKTSATSNHAGADLPRPVSRRPSHRTRTELRSPHSNRRHRVRTTSHLRRLKPRSRTCDVPIKTRCSQSMPRIYEIPIPNERAGRVRLRTTRIDPTTTRSTSPGEALVRRVNPPAHPIHHRQVRLPPRRLLSGRGARTRLPHGSASTSMDRRQVVPTPRRGRLRD